MATVSRTVLSNFTKSLEALSAGSQEALGQQLMALDFSDMTPAITEMVGIMEDVCSTASEASAEIAAGFYDGMSQLQTGRGYDAQLYSGHTPGATEKAVRGIAEKGVQGNFESMTSQLMQRVDFEVKKAAGETVMQNAMHDPRRPRFARVPSGIDTCDFCIMLASRGAVYTSALTAGENNHYHPDCRCRIVPMWNNERIVTAAGGVIYRNATTIQGYNPDAYFEQYLQMAAEGKVWVPKHRRYYTSDGRVATPNLARMSSTNRRDYLRSTVEEMTAYLAEGLEEDYEAFMQRGADVAARFNELRQKIVQDKSISETQRKTALSTYESWWKNMGRAAIDLREQMLAQQG